MFMGLGTLATLAYLFVLGSGSQVSFGLTWSFVTQLMPGKQHGRRFPFASMSQAFSIRRSRVSACLAELTQRTHSRRAMGVIFVHSALAFAEVLRTVKKSDGTRTSGSSPTRVSSTTSVSPAFAAAAS